jgi:putative pyoverdin transport system ATP-binding/permease protein
MLDFLKLINGKKATLIVVLGLISGLISFLFLAFINSMMELVLDKGDTTNSRYIILFCSLMLGFVWSKLALSHMVIKFSQQIFWKLRADILHTILKADFYQFSKRKDQIHAVLVHDIDVLTDFSLSIIQLLSSLTMTIGCFIYIGMQSMTLLLITLAVSVIGVGLYWIGVYFNEKKLNLSRELENSFMKSFLDILSGFKEIHMNPRIGEDIFNKKVRKVSHESFINNTKALSGFLNLQITGEVLFYTLIGMILIYNSSFINETPASIVNFAFVLLYLLGSINTLTLTIPELVRARIAAGKISKLKIELNDERFKNQIENKKISISEFDVLKVSDLMFTYEHKNGDLEKESTFHIGPFDFSLKKGEVVFIYGSNGSGKTTFINSILGILRSDSGLVDFNGVRLSVDNYADYRTLFSVVFNDFHLFEELYGFEHIPEKLIAEYLEMFELNNKVSFKDSSFSSTNLSTGQRKRLALIIAITRFNPILVLDEWAADQDPAFRKKFYTQIIPKLKAKGFSMIAITHDDAYYHMADKLYKMESGQLIREAPVNIIKKEFIK